MQFIGNQIRLTRALLAAAARQRNASLFQTLARQQVEAGAHWLLVGVDHPQPGERSPGAAQR
jgi:hypothetical protein